MNNSTNKPHFTVQLAAPDKHFNWVIALDGEVIHHVEHFMNFARDVCYPEQPQYTHENNIGYEVKFNEINDTSSDKCLQHKIIAYLYENDIKFRNEYSELYVKAIETCKVISISQSQKCTNCILLNKAIE